MTKVVAVPLVKFITESECNLVETYLVSRNNNLVKVNIFSFFTGDYTDLSSAR